MFGLYGDLPPPSSTPSTSKDGAPPAASAKGADADDPRGPSGATPSSAWPSTKLLAPLRKTSMFAAPPSVLRAQAGAMAPPRPSPKPPSGGVPRPTPSTPPGHHWTVPGAPASQGPLHADPGGGVPEEYRLNGVQAEQPGLVGVSAAVLHEYDPAQPNDYEEYCAIRRRRKLEEDMRREEERRQREDEERQRARERELERERQRALEREQAGEADDEPAPRAATLNVSGEEAWKRRAMLSGGPPPELRRSPSPPEGAGPGPRGGDKALTFAQKMMLKMGWKEGQGLGKSEQGITAPLQHKKTDRRQGVIVHASVDRPPEKKPKSVSFMGMPTRVVMLRNMVGPGEVDDELEEEVAEECSKFGPVAKVLIFEVTEPGFPPNEAVRIFVQFDGNDGATKALIELDGRFFGGRVVKATFFDEAKFELHELAPVPGATPGTYE